MHLVCVCCFYVMSSIYAIELSCISDMLVPCMERFLKYTHIYIKVCHHYY